jgi:two-component sensor histidine kinase
MYKPTEQQKKFINVVTENLLYFNYEFAARAREGIVKIEILTNNISAVAITYITKETESFAINYGIEANENGNIEIFITNDLFKE